jgi:hypothetical protein
MQSNGTICGLAPATALQPAEFSVQLVDTGCVAFTRPRPP